MSDKKIGPAGGATGLGAIAGETDNILHQNHERRNIRARLREYLAAKNIKPNQNDFIHCPFHEEKTPSCKVNDDYVYCFGCSESGDIYKVAAALIGVSCDKENFREIAAEVERTLGIPEWQPAMKPCKPKTSKSAVYRSELLKDFAKSIDTNDMERAYFCASLLFALFMLPEAQS